LAGVREVPVAQAWPVGGAAVRSTWSSSFGGGPSSCWPNCDAAACSVFGVSAQPSGLGWLMSQPAVRKKPLMPAGVQMVSRSTVSEVNR